MIQSARAFRFLLLCGLFAFGHTWLSAQTSSGEATTTDSLAGFSLQTVVVTADRAQNTVAATTSSVSNISSTELRALPVQKLADATRYLPGLFMVDKDGSGRDPVISSRGFYGGGEAEYLLVLVDGRPINDLETGLVNWNLVPSSSIGSMELVRGSASPLYGDIALGGVMNIITRQNPRSRTNLSLSGGSYGALNGSGSIAGSLNSMSYQLSGSSERTNGFRSHSDWKGSTVHGTLDLPFAASSNIHIDGSVAWTNLNDPGVLTESERNADPRQSSVYYKADGREEQRQNILLEDKTRVDDHGFLSVTAYGNFKHTTAARTLTTPGILFPSFQFRQDTTLYGDTKQRDLKSSEAGGNLQYTLAENPASSSNRLIAGVDGSYGKLTSTYYNMFGGFQEEYASHTPSRGAVVADGDAARAKFAVYSNVEFHPATVLTMSFGGRYDFLRDSYSGTTPDTSIFTSHTSVSVKYGLNYHYMTQPGASGNMYANFNKSFKAPTLDQLTDQRPIDVAFFKHLPSGTYLRLPFPPFAPYSNATLTPQTSYNYEFGAYQEITFSDDISAEQTLSLYKMDVKNEIDFDLSTFHYRNIQESQHLGIESGSKVRWSKSLSTFLNYTWTSVRFTAGVNDGKFLKAIPRNNVTIGATYASVQGIGVSLDWTFTNGTWLDDDNTLLLSDFNYGNARLSYRFGQYQVFADVQNILDRSYSSTGYILYGTTYYLPAAGRTVQGGVTVEF